MAINLDPKIVRKTDGVPPSPCTSSYSELDRPQPSLQKLSNVIKADNRDPAQVAFATDSAFRSRIAR